MGLVSEVEPKHIGYGWPLRSEEDVEHFVEQPLIKAVKALLEKNIHPSQSSANQDTALSAGRVYIELDISSLIPENLVTLAELSLGPDVREGKGGYLTLYKHHGLQLDLTPEVTIEQVEEDFLAMTALLTQQEPWRARPLTLMEARQALADRGEKIVKGEHPDLIMSNHLRNWRNELNPYCYLADNGQLT